MRDYHILNAQPNSDPSTGATMYPALKDFLSTKLLDPKDFPTAITSYLRVQLDNIRRYYLASSKKVKFNASDFCNHKPLSVCSFTVLMEKLYTQIILGKSLGSKTVTLYEDLQEKMDFFPLIIYKTKYFKGQPVAKLYNDLSDLLSNETMPDKHSLFVLHTHLLVLHLAESKNKHDNILVSFLQNLNPEMKLTASEINYSLEECYDVNASQSFDRFIWNPLLSNLDITCVGSLFDHTLSKVLKPPDRDKTNFNMDPAFYRDVYILHEQLMYLQAFDVQKSMAKIITQLLMHDQIFELPFSSMVNAKKEINGQLNKLLAEEMKSADIALNFVDIVQLMTGSIDRFIFEFDFNENYYNRITTRAIGLANTANTIVAEYEAKGYIRSLYNMKLTSQNRLSKELSICFSSLNPIIKEARLKLLKLWNNDDLCTIIMANMTECQQLCQQSNKLKEFPKVANHSRLLYNTAYPSGYKSNRKQMMTTGPVPFCLFDKQIKGALKKLDVKKFDFEEAEANFGYNFCDETFQSYTDSGLCTVLNVQKGSGQLKDEYNAIPSYGQKQYKVHYPQATTRWIFEDGIILVLDSWAFNGLVTKKHNSFRDPRFENQLVQSEMSNNFKVLLHDHNEIPMMLDQTNRIIRLDRDKELASVPSFYTKMKVEVADADENVRTVEVKKRKCRFEDEIDGLEIFSTYSKVNCLYECRYQLAKEKCHCVPWNFPHKSTDELCDPVGGFCFMRQISWLSENLNDVENIGSPPCGCYPSCKGYKYTPVGLDFVPKSPKWFDADDWQKKVKNVKKKYSIYELFKVEFGVERFLVHYILAIFYGKSGPLMPQHENLGPMSFFYNESSMPQFASANVPYFQNSSDDLSDRIKNIAILYIDFDRSHYRVRKQIKRMTLASMLSSFGGILGLFLGFSVIGLLDLIFWARKRIERIDSLRNWNPRDGFGKMKAWLTVQLSRCRKKDKDKEETCVKDFA